MHTKANDLNAESSALVACGHWRERNAKRRGGGGGDGWERLSGNELSKPRTEQRRESCSNCYHLLTKLWIYDRSRVFGGCAVCKALKLELWAPSWQCAASRLKFCRVGESSTFLFENEIWNQTDGEVFWYWPIIVTRHRVAKSSEPSSKFSCHCSFLIKIHNQFYEYEKKKETFSSQ